MMIRKILWAVLVVGVALIVAPLAMGLPDKADGGQQMIDGFAPIMDEQNVQTTADYYYEVASLPDFTLFTWFFVIPGVVLVGLAVTGLFLGREPSGSKVDDKSFVKAA
jgi:hypothetical protein